MNLSGNVIGPNVLLKLLKTEGIMFNFGINYSNNEESPHRLTLPLIDTNSGGIF